MCHSSRPLSDCLSCLQPQITKMHQPRSVHAPVALQLELVNLWHSGELQRLLATVTEGDVTVNLVSEGLTVRSKMEHGEVVPGWPVEV